MYEVPYSIGDDAVRRWREYADEFAGAGRDEAIELLQSPVAGSSEESIAAARSSPHWPADLAHTLAYDAACLGDGLPPARFAKIGQPVLVATGGGAASSSWPATPSPRPCRTRSEWSFERQGHVADPAGGRTGARAVPRQLADHRRAELPDAEAVFLGPLNGGPGPEALASPRVGEVEIVSGRAPEEGPRG